ncbi:hypothetical protein ACWEN3_39185, partial [Streptomyces sp. NPDC004561]
MSFAKITLAKKAKKKECGAAGKAQHHKKKHHHRKHKKAAALPCRPPRRTNSPCASRGWRRTGAGPRR